jgi:hypothetical protein
MISPKSRKLLYTFISFMVFWRCHAEESPTTTIDLNPILDGRQTKEHLRDFLTNNFSNIIEVDFPEVRLADLPENVLEVDFKSQYKDKVFTIKTKKDLHLKIKEAIQKNFKALALEIQCDAEKIINDSIKEFIQFQLFEHGWNSKLEFKNLLSEVKYTIDTEINVLEQKFKKRFEMMMEVEIKVNKEFNKKSKSFGNLKNKIIGFLISASKLITENSINDPEFLNSGFRKIKLAKLEEIAFIIRKMINEKILSAAIPLFQTFIKELYRKRKDAVIPKQKEFISEIILLYMPFFNENIKSILLMNALRQNEIQEVEQSKKSSSLEKYKIIANRFEDNGDVFSTPTFNSIVLADKITLGSRFDEFNLLNPEFIKMMLRTNSNILNLPSAIRLFELSKQSTLPIFEILYRHISELRIKHIDEPLEINFAQNLVALLRGDSDQTHKKAIAVAKILISIYLTQEYLPSKPDLECLETSDSDISELLKDSKFRQLYNFIMRNEIFSEDRDEVKMSEEELKKLVMNQRGNKNIVIQKIGSLSPQELEYLENPENISRIIKGRVSLQQFNPSVGKKFAMIMINPAGSVCFEQSLKDYFTRLI